MARPAKQAIWSATDGTVLAEAAFILPLLLVLVFGVEEYGRMFLSQTVLQRATYAAARCGAVNDSTNPDYPTCPDAGSIQTYASGQLLGILNPASVAFTVPTLGSCPTLPGPQTAIVEVTATYTFNFLVNLPGLLNSSGSSTIPLSATAIYNLQC